MFSILRLGILLVSKNNLQWGRLLTAFFSPPPLILKVKKTLDPKAKIQTPLWSV